ncbi:MAG: CTP synthetase [Rickettsiales bacterium]|nr:CTP synthetase [Rickettsiales bacterium]RPG16213.1 MAG: CTP synthase [Pelagibacteraceae bacterium TMED195]|tara:strand:+ start:1142 stop:2770 length:1629 start_codon:yes stop_codon:yes gene_type:complete
MTRYIFITGGVVSSLGKGIVTSSLASLLKLSKFKLRIRKLDPYLNIDPGTMNPAQHGEVFVTDDGAETDMDLGHYERFTGIISKKNDNITTGKVYSEVLRKERKGDYLGSTVQVIPHVTEEIKKFIKKDLKNEDFVICEIGGTVGDIESLPFLEALRQLRNELGTDRSLFIHITLVPFISSANEFKTKPTQHSVKELLGLGIQPDLLICRTEKKFSSDSKKKISLFCNLSLDSVLMLENAQTIYEVPLKLHNEGLLKKLNSHFSLKKKKTNLDFWNKFHQKFINLNKEIDIAIVGKYTNLSESYKSLNEALFHSGIYNNTKVNISWIDSRKIVDLNKTQKVLKNFHGILVPGGFGKEGSLGKINAIKFAKKFNVPFLGICFGMQLAIIESLRDLKGYEKSSSTEFGKTDFPAICMMHEWEKDKKIHKQDLDNLGGSMRLGSYESILKKDTLIFKIYKKIKIFERHRHRYEVNYNYLKSIEKSGITLSGMSPNRKLVEIIERAKHPWFIGVQFHPELKSTPFNPHPIFNSFISAVLKFKNCNN